jgi:F-type H+-transporting ATPase subunit b
MHFDWSTLALQTLNVLILVWLLRRFLFRPVVDIVARRKDAADKLLADAAATNERAQAAAAEIERREETLTAEGNRILAGARMAAEAERTRLLSQAKDEAAQAHDAAQAALDRTREQMRRELEAEARHLAVTIASRLLGRVPPAAIDVALLQSFEAWLGGLAADELRSLAQPDEVLELVTATGLDAKTQAECTDILTRCLGRTPMLHFRTDPSLIAGVELRSQHVRLRNNWRADLDRIAEELSRDAKQFVVA